MDSFNGGLLDPRMAPQMTGLLGAPQGAPGTPPAPAPGQVNIGGITAPAPHAALLPPAAAPSEKQSLLGRVHDSLVHSLGGDKPTGYEGLLSPTEIQSTRHGLLGLMFGAPDMDPGAVQQGKLDHMLALKQATVAQQRTEELRTKRGQIMQQFPVPTSGSQEDFNKWAQQVYPALMSIGDYEGVQHMNAVMQQIAAREGKQPTQHPVEHIDAGDHIEITDPITGKVIRSIPKGQAPKDPAAVSADRKFGADQKNKILDDYARDTKDFHQVMSGWDVLTGATKDPSLATPFAITDAYARITNPGGIVRPTTMEMIDNMGSVGQRMRKYWEHNANGQLPPDIMRDFQRTLYNIVREHKNQYDSIRKQAITRARQSGITDIDPLLQDYTVVDPLTPTTASGATTGKNPLLR